MIRPLLFVPADAERVVARAHERGADAAVILELEDGVTPARKDMAREGLAAAAAQVGRAGALVFVRVNSTPERLAADLGAAYAAGATVVLLPKATPTRVVQAAAWLDALGARLRLLPVVEDAAGVLEARAVAAASPRVFGLLCGGEDLATDLGGRPTPEVLRLPKLLVHYAARAAGVRSFGLLRSIADYRDLEAIRAAATEARMHGFDGASCVHPAVVPLLNEAFAPDAAELERAHRLLATYDAAVAMGQGVCVFDGEMVDAPVAMRARRLLEEALHS